MHKRGGPLRVASYRRVSREEQVEGYSLDYQARVCREEAAKRGWQIVEEYVEEGRSAKTDNPAKRPEFRRMMQDAGSGHLDVVLVHKLDRFSRNLRVTLDS
jgi:site-specific DNA recombinase